MDNVCKICGLDAGQDHTPCFEVIELRALNLELEAEVKDRHDAEQVALKELRKADDRIKALEAQLDALLIGLQVREITDLKTKTPEHFAKIAECIADDSQEKAAKIMVLEAEVARLKIEVDVAESLSRSCPAPCGHSSQYCYTEDGGKHIVCLLCEYNVAKAALEASDGT